MSSFAICNAQGLAAERLLQRLLEEDGHKVTKVPGRFAPYDLISENTVRTTWECKRASNVLKYGTVVVEVACKRRGDTEYYPSGLTTSTADYWVFVADMPGKTATVWVVPTDILRERCADIKPQNAAWSSDHPTRIIRLPVSAINDFLWRSVPFEASNWC